MKKIKLSQGYVALVDDRDYKRVSAFKWHADVRKRADGTLYVIYATRWQWVSGKGKTRKGTTVLLHRFVLGVSDPKTEVDHKDHDGLDCRRKNLRKATKSQNKGNQRKRRNTSSQYKGVHWNTADSVWIATLGLGSVTKNVYLGSFSSERKAARAYDEAARKHFGEFALTNFKEAL